MKPANVKSIVHRASMPLAIALNTPAPKPTATPVPARAAARGSAGPRRTGYSVQDGMAVISMAGPLLKYPTLLGAMLGCPSMSELTEQVRGAAGDSAVKGILLWVDSPGGTVAGVSDLADAVYSARREKPVVAYISDMGASAAYLVASQADRIYCDTDAMVGSIGVYSVVPDYSAMAEEEGITVHVIRSGEMKGAGQPGTVITEEQLADFQREVNQLNETFIDAVVRGRGGRGLSRERVLKLNDGRVHVGAHAKALGLVDGIMSFQDAAAELQAEISGGGKPTAAARSGSTAGHAARPAGNHLKDRGERLPARLETLCDRCGHTAGWAAATLEKAYREAAADGWTLGTSDLCPDCVSGKA